jgi:hypothetical protein
VTRLRGPAGLAPALLLVAIAAAAQSDDSRASADLTGHLKVQGLAAAYSEESFFYDLVGSSSQDANFDLRLNLSVNAGGWSFAADAQAIGLYGDTIEITRPLRDESLLLTGRFPDDELRLFDLTKVHSDDGRFAGLTRLDRLSIGYTGSKGVVRLGRQAITWGNGFVYTPMDIFNPFDPTTVDKEYKAGDDMAYAQLLRNRGDDLQAVAVFRRDPLTGEVSSDQGSTALKYHSLIGVGELDLLVAEHYDDAMLGVGGNRSIGGAVWRGDLVLTKTVDDTVASLVTSVSYSWIWGGKNTSGLLEYFYNGFGQSGGRYSSADLASNPELVARVVRGELFNLGRNYLAASATIEITPLFLLTPNLFVNLGDPSALLQIVTQNDLAQDLVLQGALGLPIGPRGSEFGGIEAGLERYLSNEANLFLQLAWYF